jgi:hypothetical protein
LSAKDRARRKEQTPEQQLAEAIEQKKSLPRPVARGLVDAQKVHRTRLFALEHLGELPELLAKTTPGSLEHNYLTRLELDFSNVVSDSEALANKPGVQSSEVNALTARFIKAKREFLYARSKLSPST